MGHAVVTANTTEKAWRAVQAAPEGFDVAVLDATMTGMPMEDLARNMLNVNQRLCVLASSGYPVDISTLESAAPGRVGFLHKPFSPEMLAAAVRRMLGAQKAQKEGL